MKTTEEIYADWEQEEKLIRSRLMPPGVLAKETMLELTGLEMLSQMLAGLGPPPPIGQSLGFLLVAIGKGEAVFQGRPNPQFYNPMGTVHGGWIATILDSCVGCAIHTLVPSGKVHTTAELKVNYVRPITTEPRLVRAYGKVLYSGNKMATAEGKVLDAAGKLYAHASTTCLIFDPVH
ncbi:MAG: PaaI family thioesterase [Gammaproteobacteria bacterium]|nr:PaaI family thioesterase [Gammaproteobacteria bacterium]